MLFLVKQCAESGEEEVLEEVGDQDDGDRPAEEFTGFEVDLRVVEAVAHRAEGLADHFGGDTALPGHAERGLEGAVEVREERREVDETEAARGRHVKDRRHLEELRVRRLQAAQGV